MSEPQPPKHQCVTPGDEEKQWLAPLTPPIKKLDQLLYKYNFPLLAMIAEFLSPEDLSQFSECSKALLLKTTPILTCKRPWSWLNVDKWGKDDDPLYGPRLRFVRSLHTVPYTPIDELRVFLDSMPSLRVLIFGRGFCQSLEKGVLPHSLTHLEFGDNYNQPIDVGVLPPGLKRLTFGWYYNQQIGAGVLPPCSSSGSGLEYLAIP